MYKEVTHKINVPANTGRAGFLHTIGELLKRPRVQEITVDSRGTVTYKQYVNEEIDDSVVGIEFGAIAPSGIIRNSEVIELVTEQGANAASVIIAMCDRIAQEQLYPVALVSGANTIFWEWLAQTSGVNLTMRKSIFGLPFYSDRGLPDTALVLCAAYTKDAAMIDTKKAYKIEMEYELVSPPDTAVEVI